jgi:2-keto-4-pentenoate hydratase
LSEPASAAVAAGLEAQMAVLAARQAAGDELIGWKIGLNLEPVQRHLGIERPVVGHLTTGASIAPGATHSVAGGARVGVEPEVAIHLGDGAEIASLGPAIEVVDLDPAIEGLEEILAGNVFHRGLVLGDPVEGAASADLDALEATVTRNGTVAERARFAETGEDPAEAVRIVAERLALVGEALRPGQVIIAGSLTPIVFVEGGDVIEVGLGPLGTLQVAFGA